MNKKSNKKNKLSQKDKLLYKLFFSIVFTIELILIASYFSIVLLINRFQNYLYVEPSTLSTILYLSSLIIGIIYLLFLYNKTYSAKIPINKLRENIGTKKYIISAVTVSLFFIVAVIFNISNISYITSDGEYRSTKNTFTAQDIDSVEVSAEKHGSYTPRAGSATYYTLACKISVGEENYYLDSSFFYGYENMYEYLTCIDKDKITIIDDRFDDLIKYENKLQFKKNETEHIERIREMGTQ